MRKDKPLFGIEERLAFIDEATEHLGNVRAEPFRRPRRRLRAAASAPRAIVKGLRAISDFEYELEMDQLNRLQAPDIESALPDGQPAVQFPELQRRQGAGHVRRRHRRTRPRARSHAG